MKRIVLIFLLPASMLWSQLPRLETIHLYGNTRIRDSIILQELNLKPGVVLSDSLLEKDRFWLLRQDFLRRVEFQIKPGTTTEWRHLLLVVQEKAALSVSPVFNINDLFGWYEGFQLVFRNLWGRRNRFEVHFQLGGIRQFSASWANPWFAGRHRLFSQLEVSHVSFPYLYADHPVSFDEYDTGVFIQIGKNFGRKFRLGIGTGAEQIRLSDSTVTISHTNQDVLYTVRLSISADTRDWPLYPRNGIFIESDMHHFGLPQSQQFQRWDINIRWYIPVYQSNILAVQSQIILSKGDIPVYKRLHIGGSRTIRGYPTGLMAGENIFLASMEYRFPVLYERNPLAGIHVGWAGVFFLDAGTAWYSSGSPTLESLRLSAGFGVHLIWDRWILRGEYGNHGQGWGFINLGTGIKF